MDKQLTDRRTVLYLYAAEVINLHVCCVTDDMRCCLHLSSGASEKSKEQSSSVGRQQIDLSSPEKY